MPRLLRLAAGCLMFSLTFVGQVSGSKASAKLADVSDSPMLSNGKSGTALLDKLVGNVSSLGAYKYDGVQEAPSGKKVLKASGTFIFKPASAMRVEVKQFGSKSGSILVKSPSGKITGKGGAQMFGIKMSLGPDSRLLQMLNGFSAFDCDLASLFGRLKKEAASGCKIVAADQPTQVEGLEKPAIVIETHKASGEGARVVDRVFVDPSLKVPMQWDQFENGKFQCRSKFQNYQTNLQLDDSQFNM